MPSRLGRARDKSHPGLQRGMGLRVTAFCKDLGEKGSCPSRCRSSSPHPSSPCADFSHHFFHPSFWVCYSIGPTRRLHKQHWEGGGELSSPLLNKPRSVATAGQHREQVEKSRIAGSDDTSEMFTSQSTLQISNKAKAHYKLKEAKEPPPPTAHTHVTAFRPGRGRIIFPASCIVFLPCSTKGYHPWRKKSW